MFIEIKVSKYSSHGAEVEAKIKIDGLSTPERRARIQTHIDALSAIIEEPILPPGDETVP